MGGNQNQLLSPKDFARWKKAQAQLLSRQYHLAIGAYKDLTRRFPAVSELWFEFGNAAIGELDFDLANRAYRKAMELSPKNASLMVLIGQQYQGLRQLNDARDCFERAVAADPSSIDARISLAVWFEKERKLTDAWNVVEACLAQNPKDDQARYFKAFLLHRQKKNSEAETILRDLIKSDPQYPYVKYASRHLLGVVLDEAGQYPEAMRWLLEAKDRVRQLTDVGLLEREYDKTDEQRRKLLSSLTPEMIKKWQTNFEKSVDGQIAFLGGHPRSGTTLLEQILDAHPEILAFDESIAFNQEITGNIPLPLGDGNSQVRALDSLPVVRTKKLRERYIKSLLREAPNQTMARRFIDKNPSPTMSLPHWLRVFPGLKIIIALRDPRDVIVSCFFLNLMLNATNMNFLTLERTAKHYADLMDVWLRVRELGGFDWIETRYEDVVQNIETEGRRVMEFLGLSWHPDQARYHETARRKFLFAPTYHDVTQPIYRRAIGRWERYAEFIEPIQKKLKPYCQAFGYQI